MMTVQRSMEISNPKLADEILHFLLLEETTAFPAQVLSKRVWADAGEVKEHIAAINRLKARWIYEIPQPDGRESFYIIGNCKTHIKEHLKKGGFQQAQSTGIEKEECGHPGTGKNKTSLHFRNRIIAVVFFLLIAATLLLFLYY
ncbi:MAG: hypothetical protein KF862_17875 [Chitinophagaceae bacterium]|nr:hypothetical protein [Chitinophagaceae bacterium]